MSPPAVILPFLLLLLSSAAEVTKTTLQELLKEYNFPAPDIKLITFNKLTGDFKLDLHNSFYFNADNIMQLKCKPTIRGVISKQGVTKLEGVSTAMLGFAWVDIQEITRDGDTNKFLVGLSSKEYIITHKITYLQRGWDRVLGFVNQKMNWPGHFKPT